MKPLRYIKHLFLHDRNTRYLLKQVLTNTEEEINLVKEESILRRIDYFNDKCMHDSSIGISHEKLCDDEVIVSLTSYGERINEVYLPIESIMQGTVKPNRIILWLSEEEFKGKRLPLTLQKQQQRGLQIEYCKDIKSYKKIIPTMQQYPDACVITIDDDVMYGVDFVENLVYCHITNPKAICANRIHQIKTDGRLHPMSYLQWEMEIKTTKTSNLNFLTGVGGNLYPPHCFIDEFFDEQKFMELCPFGDDIWINAMIWMSNKKIVQSYTHSDRGCDYIEVRTFQKDALCNQNTNAKECRNDVQIKAVFDYYDLYHYLSE